MDQAVAVPAITSAGTAATDIEHIVALAEAHDSGIADDRRRDIASDLDNLTIADPTVNSRKGARDAAEWMPIQHWAWFAERVIQVKLEYGLTVDPVERDALKALIAGGGAQLNCVDCDIAIRSAERNPHSGCRSPLLASRGRLSSPRRCPPRLAARSDRDPFRSDATAYQPVVTRSATLDRLSAAGQRPISGQQRPGRVRSGAPTGQRGASGRPPGAERRLACHRPAILTVSLPTAQGSPGTHPRPPAEFLAGVDAKHHVASPSMVDPC